MLCHQNYPLGVVLRFYLNITLWNSVPSETRAVQPGEWNFKLRTVEKNLFSGDFSQLISRIIYRVLIVYLGPSVLLKLGFSTSLGRISGILEPAGCFGEHTV